MAITIRDVAEAAGVSTATVSRALRGLPNVDPATRDRIAAVASKLDYVISPSASRLASGRTGSIAVITPFISRWFFATVLSGVESVLQAAGMDLLLMSVTDAASGHHRLPPAPRLRRRVDGVLIIAMSPSDPQLRDVLNLGMPTSMIGVNIGGVPSVTIDDVAAARIATQHLINLGHTRIGMIGGSPAELPFTAEFDRESGFRQAMEECGLETTPTLEAFGYFTIQGGEQAMTALLTQKNPPTAVFAMSDEMAFGALRSLRNHGLKPGVDISVVGVDGHDMSEHLELTTVVQPVFDLGRIAAEALLVQLRTLPQDVNLEPTRVPTQLIVRSSTAPLRTV
jgi:LacI family repressor for deo operon, udp, cdd, tsx, nupC, and nupG